MSNDLRDSLLTAQIGLTHMTREVQRLVREAQRGDRAAFEALAKLYRPRLEALIRWRLGAEDHLEVTDLLQETVLRALGALPRFRWKERDEGSMFRWIGGIAVNVVREALKTKDRNRYLALEFDVSSDEPSPGTRAQRRERYERLEEAIRGLGSDQRQALRLVRITGLSVTEAARHMNRSPNAVSHLLIRGLRKLRERYGEASSLRLLKPEEEASDG